MLIFIHPHEVAAADRLKRYALSNLIGNPLETTIAQASLIFGGVLERLPNLKICWPTRAGTRRGFAAAGATVIPAVPKQEMLSLVRSTSISVACTSIPDLRP